jgi:hypothetical protein
VELLHIFKEEIIPRLLKLCHKIEKEGILLNSFYRENNNLRPKANKDTIKA